ncbi:MAG: hypothetical protein WC385_02455 [Candidatus Paceibacterota bacterium]|jgi:hypothetical protein
MLTLLLAKVFGIYLIIIGLAIIFRRRYFLSVFAGLVDNRILRIVISIVELIAGLFIILTHQIWSSWLTGLITLMGWLMVIEGTSYLFMSDRRFAKLMKFVNHKAVYTIGGIIAVIIGIYLTYAGFGLGVK